MRRYQMNCMEYARKGLERQAVALRHCCSAALCLEHAHAAPKPLKRLAPVYKVETLPLQARSILCDTCMAALEQPHLPLTA